MKKQYYILIIIILFPSLIYLLLTTGKHHFIKLPYYGNREAVVKTVDGKQKTDTLYHTVAPFKFINQNGDTITEKNYEGRIYIADFFFSTCQSICPKMAVNLSYVQKKFQPRDSIFILSHTVNPDRDSAAVLNDYAKMVHADTKSWTFVTGDKQSIYKTAIESYLLPAGEDVLADGGFLHSEQFVLVDKEKHIRGLYDGTSLPDVNKLIDDIKLLQADYAIQLESKKAKEGKQEIEVRRR